MPTPSSPSPINVFVCYSHADQQWVTEGQPSGLLPWLQNQLKNDHVKFWWDHGIRVGDTYEQVIFNKIDQVKMAILLLSDDFAGSAYIMDKELPRIRKRYESGELMIIPILVSSMSRLNRDRLSWVTDIQMFPNDQRGLTSVISDSAAWGLTRSSILDEIYHRVSQFRSQTKLVNSGGEKQEQPSVLEHGMADMRTTSTTPSATPPATITCHNAASPGLDEGKHAVAPESHAAQTWDVNDELEWEGMSSPQASMRSGYLSKAFLIICAIHIVAILLIYTHQRFNAKSLSSPLISAPTSAPAKSVSHDESVSRASQILAGDFVLIPEGEFIMGDSTRADSDAPPHPVYLNIFHIAKCPVTKSLWDEVRSWARAHDYSDLEAGEGKAPDHPVHTITWYAMLKWCNARSEMDGLTPVYSSGGGVYRVGVDDDVMCDWQANGYRLPTEAEWEKAARGGTAGTRFPWGDAITHENSNFQSSIRFKFDLTRQNGYHPSYNDGIKPYTSPVTDFEPNAYGIYDMIGNTCEWCWDRFSVGYYRSSEKMDPHGPPDGARRVGRGGSWAGDASFCCLHSRAIAKPDQPDSGMGFRVVRKALASDDSEASSYLAEKSASGIESAESNSHGSNIRSVVVHEEISVGDFASRHNLSVDRLNQLNGTSLTQNTVLAKGSELYVPVARTD